MDKGKALRVVNSILFFSFVIQGITGVVLFFQWRVPGEELLSEIHNYNGLFMIACVGVHLFLNWSWVRANLFRKAVIKNQ
jgi:hypothetical protein